MSDRKNQEQYDQDELIRIMLCKICDSDHLKIQDCDGAIRCPQCGNDDSRNYHGKGVTVCGCPDNNHFLCNGASWDDEKGWINPCGLHFDVDGNEVKVLSL